MEELSLTIPGMWADHHVLDVREALSGIEGVEEVEALALSRTVVLRLDPARTDASTVTRGLDAAGYAVGDVVKSAEPRSNKPEWSSNGLRVAVTNELDLTMSGDHRKY